MVKNQLFKTIPSEDLCLRVVQAFGLESFDDMMCFSKKDLVALGTVEKLYMLKPELEEHYIPCKARTYLNGITPKNSITILRQILRCVERSVTSKEKYLRSSKYVVYQVLPKNYSDYNPVQIKNIKDNTEYLINFD